jgi:60 kDa SS-A/Ro ribonucleoprotein
MLRRTARSLLSLQVSGEAGGVGSRRGGAVAPEGAGKAEARTDGKHNAVPVDMGALLPATTTQNAEAAPAYAFEPRHAMAQYASTGCLNTTFYATDVEQLDTVLALCERLEPEFIARGAIHARERLFMKEVPALLRAVLSRRAPALLERVFPRVIDNGRMLRTFVQIVRSGVVGRKSLGSLPKRLVRRWLAEQTDEALVAASVGQKPSLADIVRMVHPRPATASREALFGWLLGSPYDGMALPDLIRGYEAYKSAKMGVVPAVPFQMLTQLPLGAPEWAQIAKRAGWQTTRMNLNTFARHGVFDQEGLTELIAERLRRASTCNRPVRLRRSSGRTS